MSEENKEWYDKFKEYLKEDKRGLRAFETSTAFLMAIGTNAIVKGFSNPDFEWKDLFDWSTLITGFAGGLGIIAVQEDAMRKATFNFETKNELFVKYRKDNLEKAYGLRDYDYQRHFVKTLNNKELQDLIDELSEKRIRKLEEMIFNIEQSLPLMPNKRRKHRKQIDQLKLEIKTYQNELADVRLNGVNKASVAFTPFRVSDIFNFNENEVKYGREGIIDNSVEIQRKKNLAARFYMPVLMMLVMGGVAGLLGSMFVSILLSSIVFAFILVFVWFMSYKNQYKLKEQITLPREIKINTHLTDAKNEYDEWKKASEPLPFDELPQDYNEGEVGE